MIELRLLEILSAFAEEGTQSAVAERLHISQPTLSGAMKRLEEEIGAPLFERAKNRMTLNENGIAAAEYAQRILRKEAAMRLHIQEMERRRRTISLATCTMSALAYLTARMPYAFPDKQVTTSLCPQHENLLADLMNGSQTFVVTDLPILDEQVLCFPCYTEHLMVLVPKDQPEALMESLSFEQLKAHQLLINGNGGAWDRYVRKKLPETSILSQSDFEDYKRLIDSRLPVWAFISDSSSRVHVKFDGYRLVPVSDEDAHLDYWCSCLKTNKKEADALRSYLDDNFMR